MFIDRDDIKAVVRFLDTTLAWDTITVKKKDGTVIVSSATIPKSGIVEINWTSAETSNEDGEIDTELSIEFGTPHTFVGFSLVNTNATSYGLEYYDTNGDLLGQSTGEILYSQNVKKIVVWVNKINAESAHATIGSVLLGLDLTLGETFLFDISGSKYIDLAAEQKNNGDCKIIAEVPLALFFGRNGEKLPESITKNQKITIFVSYDTENEEIFGVYTSTDIRLEDEDTEIIIDGCDMLLQLNESTYRKGVVATETLAARAQDVADDAGIDIVIDSALSNITSSGYISEVPHREALRLIAEAGRCALFVNDNGIVELKRISTSGATQRVNIRSAAVENTFSREDADNTQGIIVNKYAYTRQEYASEIGYIESVRLLTTPQHIDIVYSTFPVDVSTVMVWTGGAGVTITNKHVYAEHIEFDIAGTEGSTTFVTITGNPYDSVNTIKEVGIINQNAKKIENNYLIGDAIADDVAEYQYNRLVNKHEYSFESADDTIFEIGTKYTIVTKTYEEDVIATGISVSKSFGAETINIDAKSV